jgi:CDP-6-deoxy-D-xylo-4-hexulose-3-dehydrase
MTKIFYGKNVYNSKEINAVVKALKNTTQMSFYVNKFESIVSKIYKKKYCLMVNSGSSALTLALRSLDLPKSSEIIVPCLNFGTAVSSIILAGFKPVVVDVCYETLQIDENKIESKINKRTSALLIPNLIGNVPDWIKIKKIAKKFNLKIIEDSADTFNAKINNVSTSNYADVTMTSFYGSHLISCAGNGAILITNNKKLYLKAKKIRSWGRESSVLPLSEDIKTRLKIKIAGKKYDKKFVFSELGCNFEPNEIGAAFGCEQLKKFKNFAKIRVKNFNYYFSFFRKLNNFFLVPKLSKNIKTNFLAYPILIKKNKFFNREDLQIFLENNEIQTRPIFSGNILRHPAFKIIRKYNKINNFPNADKVMDSGILIGCHQGLTIKNIKYVTKTIQKFLQKFCN